MTASNKTQVTTCPDCGALVLDDEACPACGESSTPLKTPKARAAKQAAGFDPPKTRAALDALTTKKEGSR